MKTSISPEVMLKSFNKTTMNLLKMSLVFNDEEIENNFKNFLRKTLIAELLFDKYVIAVSGLQGVGKSTLLKQLYDIPKDILPENLNRGEKMPILISEHEKDTYECCAIQFKKNADGYAITKKVLSNKEFRDQSMNSSEDQDAILLELNVPSIFFKKANYSFLLLPGLEKNDEYWQQLIEHSLISSATCLFVFNERSFVDKNNAETFNNKIKNTFDKAAPLFILTSSDQSNDANEKLRSTIKQEFGIPEEENDRLICTGTTEDLKKLWIPQLKNSLDKYSATRQFFRETQIDNLDKILLKDFGKILLSVERKMTSFEIKADNDEQKVNKILEYLIKSIESLRKKYTKQTSDSLDDAISIALKEIEKVIPKDGANKWVNGIKKIFCGTNIKEQSEFEIKINEVWRRSSTHKQISVLENILSKERERYPVQFTEKSSDNFCKNKEKNNTALQLFFSNRKDFPEIQFNNQIELQFKVIPIYLLEFVRIGFLNPRIIDANTKKIDLKGNFEIDTGNISTPQNMLKAIGTVVGIDLISDGDIDTIPGINKAFGLSTSTLASSIVGTIAGMLAISISFISQVNKMEINEVNFAKNMLIIIRDRTYAHYIESFDMIMEELVNYARGKLRNQLKLPANLDMQVGLLKAIANSNHSVNEMRRLLDEYRNNLA